MVVIRFGRKEDLCLVHQSAKRLTVNYSVTVALKFSAKITRIYRVISALRISGQKCKFRKSHFFSFIDHFGNGHVKPPLTSKTQWYHKRGVEVGVPENEQSEFLGFPRLSPPYNKPTERFICRDNPDYL